MTTTTRFCSVWSNISSRASSPRPPRREPFDRAEQSHARNRQAGMPPLSLRKTPAGQLFMVAGRRKRAVASTAARARVFPTMVLTLTHICKAARQWSWLEFNGQVGTMSWSLPCSSPHPSPSLHHHHHGSSSDRGDASQGCTSRRGCPPHGAE